MPAGPDPDRLARALRRLDDRVRRWSPTRWNGASQARRGAAAVSRVEVAYELAGTLAALAREAGNGAPDVQPPRVPAHAIADQLVVLGREVLEAPTAARVLDRAQAAVDSAYDALG